MNNPEVAFNELAALLLFVRLIPLNTKLADKLNEAELSIRISPPTVVFADIVFGQILLF